MPSPTSWSSRCGAILSAWVPGAAARATTIAQLAVSAIDWTLAAAVLYVPCLPALRPSSTCWARFSWPSSSAWSATYPGGIGVFEGLVVFALSPFLTAPQLVPALVVYRAVYYVVPLTVALVGLVIDEVLLRRAHAIRLAASIGRITERLTPQMLATFTFVAGVMLLFSGATPGEAERLHWLDRVLPLGVIEASHVTGSVAGRRCCCSRKGSRRLDAAYYLTIVTVTAGVVASLLKGFDYEEALLLVALVVILLMARPAFNRKAAFFATRFSTAWIAAVAAALVASVWLGLFAFKHVECSQDLWWQFELEGNASRFLRIGRRGERRPPVRAGATDRHAPHEVEPPSRTIWKRPGASSLHRTRRSRTWSISKTKP